MPLFRRLLLSLSASSLSTTLALLVLAAPSPAAAAPTWSLVSSPSSSSSAVAAAVAATDPSPIVLTSSPGSPAVVVVDHGADIEGFPTFEVVSAAGDTSRLEITYAEVRSVLDANYMADGPLPLAAAMDTYRVNVYNITGPTVVTNRLIQGGFRYQKLNLSTVGELVLRNVGAHPTTDTTPLDALPGYFESSDDSITAIWRAGARTIQLNSIPAHTVPNFLTVSSDGARAESQAPQVLFGAAAAQLMYYNLAFSVKPLKGGFGFSVLADTLNAGIYIVCNVADRSIAAYFGHSDLGGDTPLASATLPAAVAVALGSWHAVAVSVALTDIAVSINGVKVLAFSQTSSFFGSFGLGASFGHACVFRDLSATTPAGALIYSSPLTDPSFLKDFLMGDNPADTLVDGSKRDRITYAGDLDLSAGSALVSTYGVSYIAGTLDLLGSLQLTPGFFAPTAKIQQAPLTTPIDANLTGLIGYSFTLLTAATQLYQATGDPAVAAAWAPKIAKMLDWADSQTTPSGLFSVATKSSGGDWNYYDPAQDGVVTKFNTLYAYTLQESIPLLQAAGRDATAYTQRLTRLRTAINAELWSEALGAYVVSKNITTAFAQDANALAILSGAAAARSADTPARVLASLDQLHTPVGPRPFSPAATGFADIISPYASAFHLRAALATADSAAALRLLRSLWAPMADPLGASYSGCFWEAVSPAGGPGLGAITSTCHAWASGPTAELSRYVLGVRPLAPAYAQWTVAPVTLGLQYARGRVPTPRGGAIAVEWTLDGDGLFGVTVDAPTGTTGSVVIPQEVLAATKGKCVGKSVVTRVNGGGGGRGGV
ncbi:glycoside hydrolase family 78 protein [Zopfochytrium polystomum]|nr:glycoside hydrolase family 78 protein [Zopfochytrium polystomum]